MHRESPEESENTANRFASACCCSHQQQPTTLWLKTQQVSTFLHRRIKNKLHFKFTHLEADFTAVFDPENPSSGSAEKDLLQTLMAAEQSQGSTRERELVDGDGTGDQSATDWLISGGTTLLFFISHLLFICSRTCLPGEFLMKQTRSLKTAASCDAKLPKCALSSSPNEEQTRSVKALLSLPVPPSVPPSVLCNSKPFTPRLKQIPPQRHLKSPQQTNVLIITSTFHFSRLHRRVFSCFPSPAFSFPECALGRTNNRIT